MDDSERAAIILLGMGEDKAAEVLRHMEPKQVEKIVGVMRSLQKINQSQIDDALNNFMVASNSETSLGFHSSDYIRNTLVGALGEERAINIIDKTLVETELTAIEALKWQDETAIHTLIRDEHPQVITVILTYLDSQKSASILKLVNANQRNEIMRRIATLGAISPQAITELNTTLKEEVTNLRSFSSSPIGGVKSAANIINHFDSDLENEVLDEIQNYDEKVSEEIQEHIFPFERLVELDKRSMQTLLRDIPNETMVVALKGVEESIQNSFFDNMSERAASMLKDDIEAKGPIQLNKVLAAQKEVVAIAQRMAKDGAIVMGTGSDDMVA